MAKNTWDSMWDSGLTADLPAASDVAENAYYLATDTGVLSQSDGVSTWTTVATLGLGGAADLGWFNVKGAPYLAAGDGSTDDTAAIQDAIDACMAAGGGTVFFPNGIYAIGGALQATSTYNSQLTIPNNPADSGHPPIAIRFLGGGPVAQSNLQPTGTLDGPSTTGAILQSDWAGSISGNPAVIAAAKYGEVFGTGTINWVQVTFQDIEIRTPADPKLSAIQMQSAVSVTLRNVTVSTDTKPSVMVLPTHSNATGIDMPIGVNSNPPDFFDNVFVDGYYTGVKLSEQSSGPLLAIAHCTRALEITHVTDQNHHANFGRLLIYASPRGIVVTGGVTWLNVGLLNIEHDTDIFTTVYDIDDTNNYLRGFIAYHTTLWGGGPDDALTLNGATGVSLFSSQGKRWTLNNVVDIPTGTNPSTSPTNGRRIYADSGSGHLTVRDSSGNLTDLEVGTVLQLTNKSGGSVAAGDVVIVDTSNNAAFTTTTTGRAEVSVGVAQATIANNAAGSVLVSGYAALVNVPSSVTRGHYVETHTIVKQATGSGTRRSGSFGQFLTGGTTPTAILWGQTDQTAGASAASGVSITDTGGYYTGTDVEAALQEAGAAIGSLVAGGGGVTVKDEGGALATLGTVLDFVGAGVTASGTGATKTITIPSGGISSGTSFPGSPSNGDLFYRTDLDLLCRYRSSGTRWVTTDLYRETMGQGEVAQGATTSTVPMAKMTPWATSYDLWLESFFSSTYIATTNNGSSYWTVALNKNNAAASPTSIVTFDTSADTVNNWTQRVTSIGASYTASSFRVFDAVATKTSSPGAIYWAFAVSYRLIVT